MDMRIKQLSKRNLYYLCDGKTNKGEFVWLIFENTAIKSGMPTKCPIQMIHYVKEAKLSAFER
jgi:hypothetical protein